MKASEIIKKVRAALGITQEELARAISSTLTTVNRWENNKTKPNRMARTILVDFCEKQGIEKELLEAIQKIR